MIPSLSLLGSNRKELPKKDFQRFIEEANAERGDGTNHPQLTMRAFFFNYGKNIGNKNVEIPVDEGRVADYINAL